MRFEMWKSKAQKGAFLVLIAVLIPVFLILATLAVDLGKVWAYQSKMQNAVDAAALAGAQNFTNGDQIVDRIDTTNHPNADRIARKYIAANLGDDFFSVDNAPSYQAQKVKVKKNPDSGGNEEEEWAYYRVAISRNIPMTFTKLLGFGSFDVKTDAVARIQMSEEKKGESYFDNLITFSGDMTGSFNNDNGNRIHSTFDGDVVTIGNYQQKYYDDMHFRFYTSKTKGKTPQDADSMQDAYRHVKQGDYVEYNKKYEQNNKQIIDAFESIQNDQKKCKSVDPGDQHIEISDSNGVYDYYYIPRSYSSLNFDINIGKIGGSPNNPIYVFVDGWKSVLKVFVNENMTGRPVIVMYLGMSYDTKWGSNGQVLVEARTHSFRGVIYSPYADMFAKFDSPGEAFTGSMTARNLTLHDNHGDYKFEQFALPGSSNNTSSGSGSESISGKAELVANRVNQNPSWN